MCKLGGLPAKRLVQQNVLWGGRLPLLSAEQTSSVCAQPGKHHWCVLCITGVCTTTKTSLVYAKHHWCVQSITPVCTIRKTSLVCAKHHGCVCTITGVSKTRNHQRFGQNKQNITVVCKTWKASLLCAKQTDHWCMQNK